MTGAVAEICRKPERIFGVFRAQGTCLVVAIANVIAPVSEGANGAPPYLLAGFEGPLRGGKKSGKGKAGNERKRREITPPT